MMALVISCNDHPEIPSSRRLRKVFVAKSVDENGATVFTRGGTGNIRPGYGTFRLDLTDPKNVVLRDFDANTFTGQYVIQGTGAKLILSNLTPAPSGTNGTIEFVVNSLTDTEVVLTRTSVSQKTGGLIVKYTLIPQ